MRFSKPENKNICYRFSICRKQRLLISLEYKECCELGEGKKVIRGNLSAAYERWCRKPENRFTPLGSQKFFNEMILRGFQIRKTMGEYYFMGIELLPMTNSTITLF